MIIKLFNRVIGEVAKSSPYTIASFPLSEKASFNEEKASFNEEDMLDLLKAEEVMSLDTKFLADPFIFTKNGKSYVFFEGLDHFARKGTKGFIGVVQLDADGRFIRKTAKRVLEEPFHLSYPQVFQYKGSTYLAPDTSRTKEMKIWVEDEFPYKWKYHGAVSTESLLDCTVIDDAKGDLYLVGGAKSDLSTRLFDFDFETLQINEHPSSPILADSHLFRPAGNVFRLGNVTYRPVQEYSAYYGERTHLFKIEELSKTSYKETYLNSIDKMKWNSYQSHHISVCTRSKIAIIDGSKKTISLRLGPLKLGFSIA